MVEALVVLTTLEAVEAGVEAGTMVVEVVRLLETLAEMVGEAEEALTMQVAQMR